MRFECRLCKLGRVDRIGCDSSSLSLLKNGSGWGRSPIDRHGYQPDSFATPSSPFTFLKLFLKHGRLKILSKPSIYHMHLSATCEWTWAEIIYKTTTTESESLLVVAVFHKGMKIPLNLSVPPTTCSCER